MTLVHNKNISIDSMKSFIIYPLLTFWCKFLTLVGEQEKKDLKLKKWIFGGDKFLQELWCKEGVTSSKLGV